MTTETSPSISVVVPVFRSAPMLDELYRRLAATLDTVTSTWEIILIDDASGDGTFDAMMRLREQDERVRVVRFARNSGQHHTTLCGIQRTTGDIVITLDDDLQNPPEEIPRFVAKIQEGYDLVIGKIDGGKQHSRSRNLASNLVQRLVGWILGKPRGLSLTSYRAMSRRAADGIGDFHGAHVYLPALMLAAVPLERIVNLPVAHHPRFQGSSTYTLRKLVKLASYLLINHSNVPLRFVTGWGFAICLASFGYAGYIVVRALVSETVVAGFPTLASLLAFLSGSILLCIGILGEYVGRLVEANAQTRQFPIFEEHG